MRQEVLAIIIGVILILIGLAGIKIFYKDAMKGMDPRDAADPKDPNDMLGAISIISLTISGFILAIGVVIAAMFTITLLIA